MAMAMTRRDSMDKQGRAGKGQILVLFVLALFAILAMVALVVDGGNAFAQQRLTQNWTDGAAEAGTVQLMRRSAGTPVDPAFASWDAAVVAAVNAQVKDDGLDGVDLIEYVDLDGITLGSAGGGAIPPGAAGVHVRAHRVFETYVAQSVGFGQFAAAAESTYITGFVTSLGPGKIIPLTVPVLWTYCDGQGDLVNPGPAWPSGPNNPVVLPLCKNAPGNRGWLDWTPPGGGASELGGNIADTSNAPSIRTPHWYYYPQTGNVDNSSHVGNALQGLIGQDVFIPIFHAEPGGPVGTCDSTPGGQQTAIGDCPDPGSGNGQEQWYLWVTVASFHLTGHHTNPNDPACVSPFDPSNNGSVGCLSGYWNHDVVPSEVEVGPFPPGGVDPAFALRGVQLLR
jgi:hypothetical protein